MVDPDIMEHPEIKIFTTTTAMAHVGAGFHSFFIGIDSDSRKNEKNMQRKLKRMSHWVRDTFLLNMKQSLENGEVLEYDLGVSAEDGDAITVTYDTAIMSDDEFWEHYRDIIHFGIMATLEDRDTLKKIAEIILEKE